MAKELMALEHSQQRQAPLFPTVVLVSWAAKLAGATKRLLHPLVWAAQSLTLDLE